MLPAPFSKRSYLAVNDLSGSEIVSLLERASDLAHLWDQRQLPQSLAGMRVALIVSDSGWRNTTAFDLGVRSMGGVCVQPPIALDKKGEDVEDLARYLSNWFDGIVSRTTRLETLRALSSAASVPIINARTHHNHPCEVLGDLAFYWNRHKEVAGIKVVVVSAETNVLASWIEASSVLQIEVVQVYPERGHAATRAAANFRTSTDMAELLDAHLLVTDEWPEDGRADSLAAYQMT